MTQLQLRAKAHLVVQAVAVVVVQVVAADQVG
jgi:hypothetical protein